MPGYTHISQREDVGSYVGICMTPKKPINGTNWVSKLDSSFEWVDFCVDYVINCILMVWYESLEVILRRM